MLLTLAFFAMMTVNALANDAVISIVGGEPVTIGAYQYVDVHVYVDNIGAQGISALVIDLEYTGATRTTGTRTFTAAGEQRILPVTTGITHTNLFNVPLQEPPPPIAPLRLYFEMLPGTGNAGVLLTGGRAATVRLRIDDGANVVGITPSVEHAYRWQNTSPFAIRIPETAIGGNNVRTNIVVGDVQVGLVGDADDNGIVDLGDATRIRQIVVGHQLPINDLLADVDFNGHTDLGDATRIRQWVVGHPIPYIGECISQVGN